MALPELDESNFDEVINSGEVVIVDFYLPSCGPCKKLKHILDAVASEGVPVYLVNIDKHRKLAKNNSIVSTPTMRFFKDGALVEEIVGVREKEEIIEIYSKH